MTTDAMLFGERRQFVRKQCLRLIGINDYSKLYSGHLRDLGLGGAFVEPKAGNRSEIGQELLLSIPFSLKNGYVNIHAKVAWIKYDGFGVWFLNQNVKHRGASIRTRSQRPPQAAGVSWISGRRPEKHKMLVRYKRYGGIYCFLCP